MTHTQERDLARTQRDRARNALAIIRSKIRRLIDNTDLTDASKIDLISALIGNAKRRPGPWRSA